jgi:hypothetical protein
VKIEKYLKIQSDKNERYFYFDFYNEILFKDIIEYTDKDTTSVCNLASIALKSFVKPFDKSSVDKWIIYTKPNESLSFSIFMLYIVLGILVLLRIYFPPNLKQMNTSIINKYIK